MSLATRCAACGTVFRVVRDQLRVSDGWVRCGRCSGVFNATEVLFDIDNGTPVLLDVVADLNRPPAVADTPSDEPLTITDWAGPAEPDWPGDAVAPQGVPLLHTPSTPDDDDIRISDGQEPQPQPLHQPEPEPDGWSPAALGSPGEAGAPGHPAGLARAAEGGRAGSDSASNWAPDWAPNSAPRGAPTSASPSTAAVTPAPGLAPLFLRRAERAAWWQQARVRGALGAVIGLLVATLLGQVALINRDVLAARWPASAPALRTGCRWAGCQVQALRRIDALTVDSSALSRVASVATVANVTSVASVPTVASVTSAASAAASPGDAATPYRLSVLLHNRADTAVLMPALELSLTDAQGKLVSRRVLALADLGVSQSVLTAGQQLPVTALVSAGALRIDGYTVELFYP